MTSPSASMRTAAILTLALATGCSGSTEVATAAPNGRAPSSAARPQIEGGPDGVENFRPGQPILVANQFDLTQRGYVAWNDLYPPPGRTPDNVVPVRDADGRKIAMWGVDIGWIDLATATAPGFSYEKAHEAEIERVNRGR